MLTHTTGSVRRRLASKYVCEKIVRKVVFHGKRRTDEPSRSPPHSRTVHVDRGKFPLVTTGGKRLTFSISSIVDSASSREVGRVVRASDVVSRSQGNGVVIWVPSTKSACEYMRKVLLTLKVVPYVTLLRLCHRNQGSIVVESASCQYTMKGSNQLVVGNFKNE
jgi:hypothetical protein